MFTTLQNVTATSFIQAVTETPSPLTPPAGMTFVALATSSYAVALLASGKFYGPGGKIWNDQALTQAFEVSGAQLVLA